jgi:TolB protein
MRLKSFLIVVFLAIASFWFAVPALAAAVTNKIAWMASSDMAKWSIKIMNLDGSHQRNLSQVSDPTGQYSANWPHFKPDGTKILFSSSRAGDVKIRLYTMDPDGNNVAPLSPAGAPYGTRFGKFSWDGARVVFQKDNFPTFVNLAYFQVSDPAGTMTDIPNTNKSDFSPSWSPDGQWIVFFTEVNPECNKIVKIRPDGTSRTDLTNGHYDDANPCYSPDGKYIIFSRSDSAITGTTNIYRMNADGTGIIKLTDIPSQLEGDSWDAEYAPMYSWDGKLIVYMGSPNGLYKIYKAKADGSGSQALTNDNNANSNPTFSPTVAAGGAAISLLLFD